MLRGSSNDDLIDELRDFLAGRFNDLVDAAAMAFPAINKSQSGVVSTNWPGSGRSSCATEGCYRLLCDDSEYCCSGCELVAGFYGEVSAEHKGIGNFREDNRL